MAFTPNKNLEQPARGSNVGTWDTPLNSNTGIIDNAFGGTATVALTNSPVTLSPSQYQCIFINFTGTLTANVAITFPFVGSCYTVENQTTGAFTITLQTTGAASQAICAPPGEPVDIKTDGNTGHVKYRNFGRVGEYIDMAVSAVPAWITGCTVAPMLYCNAASFSSATYPVLTGYLGGTTLPDQRGRARFGLNDGTSRLSLGGFNGSILINGGGDDTTTIGQTHIPSYNLAVTDLGHTHDPVCRTDSNNTTNPSGAAPGVAAAAIYQTGATNGSMRATGSNTTGISVGSAGGGNKMPTVSPGLVGGLTFIRAG